MTTLAINVGNTSIFCGMFSGLKLRKSFRVRLSDFGSAADFRRCIVSRIHGQPDRVALCSVVPRLTPKIEAWIRQQLSVEASTLTFDAPHGLRIGYRRPKELGADRIAAALGAATLFPRRDILVVDCGTATTVTALHRDGKVLGGAIFPGIGLWSDLLFRNTAQLPAVVLRRPKRAVGRSTLAGLQSGIFHGHVGAIREVTRLMGANAFSGAGFTTVGTGGHARLFSRENLFDVVVPELVLTGLAAFAERVSPVRL